MDTKFTEIRPILTPGIVLSTVGVLLTALFTGLFIWWLSGMSWSNIYLPITTSLLLASTMSSTDSASVFAILRSQKMNLKYNTQLGYLYIMENRLKPHFGQYRLKSLTTAVIQEYVNQLKIDGLAKSSVLGILRVLSAAYEYAIEPLQYVSRPSQQTGYLPQRL